MLAACAPASTVLIVQRAPAQRLSLQNRRSYLRISHVLTWRQWHSGCKTAISTAVLAGRIDRGKIHLVGDGHARDFLNQALNSPCLRLCFFFHLLPVLFIFPLSNLCSVVRRAKVFLKVYLAGWIEHALHFHFATLLIRTNISLFFIDSFDCIC